MITRELLVLVQLGADSTEEAEESVMGDFQTWLYLSHIFCWSVLP